jgi:hypothetical protein
MSFAIEIVDGKPGRVIAETIDDLRDALALNGHATTPRRSRVSPARTTGSAKRKTAKRVSKPKPKTHKRTTRAGRAKKRNGGAGWTQAVYDRAEAEGISPVIARQRIAAEKLTASKRKPK